MELIKNRIRMNKMTGNETTQITLDDDYMIPDSNPAIGRIIKESGTVKIESVKAGEGKVRVFGSLEFKVLYVGDNTSQIYNYSGSIPFEENINMDNVSEDDVVSVSTELDDLRAEIINPVKISIKAIITLRVISENIYDEDVTVDIIDKDPIDYLQQSMDMVSLVVNKKDTFRIKDDIDIPANKPDMYRIIWDTVQLKSVNTKLLDGMINITGELSVFVMYLPEDDSAPIQWVDTVLNFAGTVELKEASEDLISNIVVSIQNMNVQINPDANGEQRLLAVEGVLNLDIKIYGEEQVKMIRELYSPYKELETVTKNSNYESLLIKNSSRIKVSEKISGINDDGHILQICSSEAGVKIDEMSITDDGISVDGVVCVSVLYISSDDKCPINCAKGTFPVTSNIEVPGIKSDSIYYLNPRIEQMSANMVSSDEIDVKANVIIDVMVFDNIEKCIISDVITHPLDIGKIRKMPGIVGYVVQSGDTLWSIAKENYTTVSNIREVNKLGSNQVQPGDKLVLVKQIAY